MPSTGWLATSPSESSHLIKVTRHLIGMLVACIPIITKNSRHLLNYSFLTNYLLIKDLKLRFKNKSFASSCWSKSADILVDWKRNLPSAASNLRRYCSERSAWHLGYHHIINVRINQDDIIYNFECSRNYLRESRKKILLVQRHFRKASKISPESSTDNFGTANRLRNFVSLSHRLANLTHKYRGSRDNWTFLYQTIQSKSHRKENAKSLRVSFLSYFFN